ncbi:hypothetical protein HPP92_017127 [Vanilla planifolia]|uniref:Uncharacterized protein n=1 Tax=Vanilla planifolia TaxID=51239 RepID=A0A835QMH1_VANPL|nr:hypothetical protein HPP92_017127 [Vanilla planifolia]
MSSCLTGRVSGDGRGRTCGFNPDSVVKSPSPSTRSSSSSCLSEASNTPPHFISTKKARAPRKRPNQSSAEAAALLSSIYPKVFSATYLRRPTCLLQCPPDDSFPLLPSLPAFVDTGLILQQQSTQESCSSINLKPKSSRVSDTSLCWNPTEFMFRDPGSPDFDTESILDEEFEESIDSIMGSLSMNPNNSEGDCYYSNSGSIINSQLKSLMSFGFGYSFGIGISSNIRRALRQREDRNWWRSPTVAVKDISPNLQPSSVKPAMSSIYKKNDNKRKRRRRRKKKAEGNSGEVTIAGPTPVGSSAHQEFNLKPPIRLELNYDGIIKQWSGGSPFSGEAAAVDIQAMLPEMNLSPPIVDTEVRDRRIKRCKEKQRSQLFPKKIHSDQTPHVKVREMLGS